MTILEKKKRVCENCVYEETGILEYPCRDCVIETNSNWKSKDEFDMPEWME